MRKLLTSATVMLLCAVAITGCAVGSATATQVDVPRPDFERVHDLYFAERVPSGATRVMAEQAEKAAQSERDAREAAEAAEAEQTAETDYYEPYTPSQAVVRGNPDGLNSFDGVNEYNGKTETFYSTPAVYDADCHVDEDGFWRTDDGHYVVASSDYAPGTEIDISQGKAIVMDDGCESGTVDVHTNW